MVGLEKKCLVIQVSLFQSFYVYMYRTHAFNEIFVVSFNYNSLFVQILKKVQIKKDWKTEINFYIRQWQ